MNLDGKIFRSISNSAGGQVSAETRFYYHQKENYLWATYQGGGIKIGTLIGTHHDGGYFQFVYQHYDTKGVFRTGVCKSIPEVLVSGKIRLHEQWQWTCHTFDTGNSVVEEI